MDAAAARREHIGRTLTVLVVLAGLGLAGCESATSLFGSSATATQDPIAAPAAPQPALAKVMVAPIIGAPDAVAKQIQQEFTSAIEKQRVSVAVAKDERVDYTLRGYIVAAKDKQGTKVSYIWDVTDPTGKRVNRVTGEEIGLRGCLQGSMGGAHAHGCAVHRRQGRRIPLRHGSLRGARSARLPAPRHILRALALRAMAERAQAPAKQAVAAATPAPAAPAASASTTGSISSDGPLAAVVPNVNGAPGDGSTSLAAALQRELSGKGVAADRQIGISLSRGGHRHDGPGQGGQAADPHRMAGARPAGQEAWHRVPDAMRYPRGRLDGSWGKTAEQAAGAAAQGISSSCRNKAVN